MKTLFVSTLAVALAAVIILLTPAPILADAGTCTRQGTCQGIVGPGVVVSSGRAWDQIDGVCYCPLPNSFNNYCPNYSN